MLRVTWALEPAPSGAVPVAAAKTPANLKTVVVVQGTVSEYRPPSSERAPHSMTITDGSDKMRIAIWNDTWQAIPFREDLTKPDCKITARMRMSEFRGQMEGHILDAADIKKGLVSMPVTEVLDWQNDLQNAMKIAQANKTAILVFFSAPLAENSRYLEEEVFTDSRVRRAVQERFVPVKIDISQNKDLAKTLGIVRGGVVCMYEANGKPLVSAPLSSIRIPEDLLKAMLQLFP